MDLNRINSSYNMLSNQYDNILPDAPVNYLDDNRLLQGESTVDPIHACHRSWFLHQAILLEHMQGADEETRQRLELALLHGYSKAATISERQSELLGIQTTPLFPEEMRYHRNTRNDFLAKVYEAYARDIGLEAHEVYLIDNPFIREIFARELPQPGLNLEIKDDQAFAVLIDALLEKVKQGQYPEDLVLIEIVLKKNSDLKLAINQYEDILVEKIRGFLEQNPDIEPGYFADELLGKLFIVSFTQHNDQHLLLMPEFLIDANERFGDETNALILRNSVRNKHGRMVRTIDRIMGSHGYRLCPIEAKEAWLKIQSAQDVLADVGVPAVRLATTQRKIPRVCKSIHDFIHHPSFVKFGELAKENSPYLKVLPLATIKLLKGFDKLKIDKKFKERKLTDLLQTSYFRMLYAMQEAVFRKEDFVECHNQIELIHQEIQTILSILRPYDQTALAYSIVHRLQRGPRPIVPSNLDAPRVHLKASGMHGLSSIIAAVESQKGSQTLNVAVAKDSYYNESTEILTHAKVHNVVILDELASFQSQPVDLFVTEFHHNVIASKQLYRSENVIEQVKGLYKGQFVAEQLTVVIDTTFDLERSPDVRDFLADPFISDRIEKGQLNLVLLRSAQKFDMLGMDNYYGGITVGFNHPESFDAYNMRMDQPEDQLRGLSYQGLAHLHRCACGSIDAYRKAMMKNARRLYDKLPKQTIYADGTSNPLQISKMEDRRLIFLDIKFPHLPRVAEAFKKCLVTFARNEHLPFTTRASFGFANTSFTVIGKKMRLNIGLEDENTLNHYVKFFAQVQDALESAQDATEDELVLRLQHLYQ